MDWIIVASLLILRLPEKTALLGDAAIGMVSALGLAGGILLASLGHGFNVDLFSYLFGDVLAVSRTEALLDELKERCGESALFFIDLDGFKSVNDAHGHDAGDHVLKSIAAALLGIVRSGDVVARVGGDEFVILVNGNASLPLPDLEDFARRILAAVRTETRYGDRNLVVGASVGLTRLANESDSYDAAVMRADKAMYRVKSQGKNGFATA